MSEIRVDNLKGKTTANTMTVLAGHATDSTTTTNLEQGLLKMWVNAQANATINDSFNVTSGTDLGVGNYQYNFTNNQNSTTYAQLSSSRQGNADNGTQVNSQATTHCSTLIRMYNSTSTFDGMDANGVAGDLA
tara:strand:- start:335 stop:733 length:399 start_codon:yes stop_codon:yes gene_type:complete